MASDLKQIKYLGQLTWMEGSHGEDSLQACAQGITLRISCLSFTISIDPCIILLVRSHEPESLNIYHSLFTLQIYLGGL